MGTLTLTELKDEVRAGLGNRTDLDTRLTRFLNLAQQRVARLHDFDEMEQISTGLTFPYTGTTADKTLDLPTGYREIHAIKLIDGLSSNKLRQVTARMWNRLVPAPQELSRGRPSIYQIWGQQFQVYPLPDQEYEREVWWTKWPTAFSDSSLSATSDYEAKDEILIELALVYAFNSLAKVEQAQAHWSRARPLLVEAVETDQNKPDLEIVPGPSASQLEDALPGEYWNDPFMRSSP